MKASKLAPFILILLLGVLLIIVRTCRKEHTHIPEKRAINAPRGLNRSPDAIHYTKHARCRMACRHITESEIKSVIKNGTINYKKSELQTDECKKRYAVEDIVNKQRIRIIVAPCQNELTVITCIDLEKEWECECP